MPSGGLDGLEQVAVVQAVDQVGDDLGVGLAVKHIALGLQGSAQFVVVFNDAVVHQRNAARAADCISARAVAEVGVGVVHGRCAMGGPAGVGNAGGALQLGRR